MLNRPRGCPRPLCWLLAALGHGLACSDREAPEEDEEALRICAGYCEQLEDCDVGIDSPTVDECAETCADYDWAWRDGCRTENVAIYACLEALSCDDFAIEEDPLAEYELKSCNDERHALAVCVSDHGGFHD